jgi:alpha-amylase
MPGKSPAYTAGARFTCRTMRAAGVYAARVEGWHGDLYVHIGGSDAQWEPGMSRYSSYREYAQGAGWKVWVGLPGNPEVRQAPLKPSLPIPAYVPAEQIDAANVL